MKKTFPVIGLLLFSILALGNSSAVTFTIHSANVYREANTYRVIVRGIADIQDGSIVSVHMHARHYTQSASTQVRQHRFHIIFAHIPPTRAGHYRIRAKHEHDREHTETPALLITVGSVSEMLDNIRSDVSMYSKRMSFLEEMRQKGSSNEDIISTFYNSHNVYRIHRFPQTHRAINTYIQTELDREDQDEEETQTASMMTMTQIRSVFAHEVLYELVMEAQEHLQTVTQELASHPAEKPEQIHERAANSLQKIMTFTEEDDMHTVRRFCETDMHKMARLLRLLIASGWTWTDQQREQWDTLIQRITSKSQMISPDQKQ